MAPDTYIHGTEPSEQERLAALNRMTNTTFVRFLDVPAGALVRPKDPLEYVRKVRFQQGVASLRDYGVAASGLVA